MNANFLRMYEDMTVDLKKILGSALPEKQIMEDCFRCCIMHWNKIKLLIKSEGFDTDKEEIHFFKNIKPRFTGEIEYYTLRYHAIQFKPEGDQRTTAAYWSGEVGRIDKFFGTFHDFHKYWKDGSTEKDKDYFLRRNNVDGQPSYARVFDLDEETTTAHGSLLGIMIGYDKYKKWGLEEIEKNKRLENFS